MLYILAAWTGFRRKEISSLTLRSFDLDADPPTVCVQAAYSKRRRLDSVPLHPVVVERLREWMAAKDGITPDVPLFPLKTRSGHFRKTARMMKRDLERAGLPYQDEDGLFADFHANRHTFISNLGKAGVQPKVAQSLARHSDINLTMNVYTHVGLGDQAFAVEALPAPPGFDSETKEAGDAALQATGTLGPTEVEHVPRHVPPDDAPCLLLAQKPPLESGEATETSAKKKPLSGRDDTVCHPMVAVGGDPCSDREDVRAQPLNQRVGGSSPPGGTQ